MNAPTPASGRPLRSGGRTGGRKRVRRGDDASGEQAAQGEVTGAPWEEGTVSMQNPKTCRRSAGGGHKATAQSSRAQGPGASGVRSHGQTQATVLDEVSNSSPTCAHHQACLRFLPSPEDRGPPPTLNLLIPKKETLGDEGGDGVVCAQGLREVTVLPSC